MSNSVRISEVCKTYPKSGTAALRDITFDVSSGELFGLIGPDGAGKTTLFRILTTLLLADSGSAFVCCHEVVQDYKAIRKIVGYMPGRFSLYQDLTVEENLRFFATVFGTTLEANDHLIRDIYVQLEPFKARRAGKLSGGMKQKLALCCALVHEPRILFLDEPTTGVDPVSRKEFWDMLDVLKRKGITILVSTPYMDEAARCDRIALIQKGDLLEVNSYAGILENHRQSIIAVRSDAMHRLLNDLRGYPGCTSCYSFGSTHHAVLETQSPEAIAHVRMFLESKGHEHLFIEAVQPDIEDVFIELMSEAQ
jgi:ABC-type multidrug transport system ATPase subunit